MDKFYITTAIDYPNSKPHIGTAFEKIGADVQARYHRMLGDDVYFLMGNDENTLKVAQRAYELGEDPKKYVDRMAGEFKTVWKALDISYDDFIQTTEERHKRGVYQFLNTVNASGFIYTKQYTGLYCDGCEAFKTGKDIVNGATQHCPDHKSRELRVVSEENYFFALSKFKEELRKSSMVIQPESRKNEVLNLIEEVEDISISRNNTGWGIPIPWDNEQVIYVWFDALLNYLTGIGFGSVEQSRKCSQYWAADIHFIGKDITRFHCIMFPAMIMAYNKAAKVPIALPKRVFAHGFIKNRDGDKIAKSGAFVDPMEIVAKYGVDAYRYYFLAKCDYGSDGEYDGEHFQTVYNADLANNLGNLVSRVVSMTMRYFDGVPPVVPQSYLFGHFRLYHEDMDTCSYKQILEDIWEQFGLMNNYVERSRPWDLAKTDKIECAKVLVSAINGLRVLMVYLKPFLPQTASKVYNSFTFRESWQDVNITHVYKYVRGWLQSGVEERDIGINKSMLVDGKYPPLFARMES